MANDEHVLNIVEIPYDSGELRYRYARYMSANGTNWIRHGLFQAFHKNGKLASEGTYEHGLEHGLWRDYHENGQLAAEGNYDQGTESKDWRFWSNDGVEQTAEDHRKGHRS